jgi:integrase
MSVYLPRDKEGNPRSRTYLYDFKIKPKGAKHSQRFHGSTGQTKKAAAERVEAKLKELAKTGELANAMTVAEACDRYWDEKMVNTRSADDQATNLEVISTFLGGETLLVDVTPELIARAAAERARTPIRRFHRITKEHIITNKLPTPSTVNRQLIEPLRRMLRHAKKVWRVPIDLEEFDWAALRYREPDERVRELTPEEEVRYWKALRDDYHPIVEMYLISGRRRGDWVGFPRFKVNLATGIARMPSRKKKQEGEIQVSLTERELEIIRSEIAKAPSDVAEVFTYEVKHGPHKGERRPITVPGLRRAHLTARKAAGLPDFRIHDCRHTFASRLLRAKRDLKLLMRAMDHADISSTVRYANVLDDDVRQAREESTTYRIQAECAPANVEKFPKKA